jgi:hypothetical protein
MYERGNIPKFSKPLVIWKQLKIPLACASQVETSVLYIRRLYRFTTAAERILSFVMSATLRREGEEAHLIQSFAIIVVSSWSQFILPFMTLVRMRDPA